MTLWPHSHYFPLLYDNITSQSLLHSSMWPYNLTVTIFLFYLTIFDIYILSMTIYLHSHYIYLLCDPITSLSLYSSPIYIYIIGSYIELTFPCDWLYKLFIYNHLHWICSNFNIRAYFIVAHWTSVAHPDLEQSAPPPPSSIVQSKAQAL